MAAAPSGSTTKFHNFIFQQYIGLQPGEQGNWPFLEGRVIETPTLDPKLGPVIVEPVEVRRPGGKPKWTIGLITILNAGNDVREAHTRTALHDLLTATMVVVGPRANPIMWRICKPGSDEKDQVGSGFFDPLAYFFQQVIWNQPHLDTELGALSTWQGQGVLQWFIAGKYSTSPSAAFLCFMAALERLVELHSGNERRFAVVPCSHCNRKVERPLSMRAALRDHLAPVGVSTIDSDRMWDDRSAYAHGGRPPHGKAAERSLAICFAAVLTCIRQQKTSLEEGDRAEFEAYMRLGTAYLNMSVSIPLTGQTDFFKPKLLTGFRPYCESVLPDDFHIEFCRQQSIPLVLPTVRAGAVIDLPL